MIIKIDTTWFHNLSDEQTKILLFAIMEYCLGRVVQVPQELNRIFYVAQFHVDAEQKKQQDISTIRRNAVNKRWHKNTNDTNDTNDTNVCFVSEHTNHTNDTNVSLVSATTDSQPLTPSIPSPARPRVDNNPSNCMLPNNITINNIIYNIDIDTANNISTYIDAYKGNANKQSIVDIVCQLLKSQQWLALPLLPEIINHLLVADENPATAPDCYSSVECRLIQAYTQANKNIETLRLMLIQSISRGWKIIKPVENGPQNSNISSAADQDRQRRHAIIEAVYDRYKEQ